MPPLHVLIKPASSACNLACHYCFYLDEAEKRRKGSRGIMSDEVLETVVRKACEEAENHLTLAFQGGEPTLAGLDFFRKVVAFEAQYRPPDLTIHHALQTNGTRLDAAWCEFLREHGFLVGLSLDGTRGTHDRYRRSSDDTPSFDRVWETAELLRAHRVNFNILTVVTAPVARKIRAIYRFYRRHDLIWQQYIPCLSPLRTSSGCSADVMRDAGEALSTSDDAQDSTLNDNDRDVSPVVDTGKSSIDDNPWHLTPEAYGDFLCELFDLWYDDIVRGRPIYIRTLENRIGMLLGHPPESCGMAGVCTHQHVVEADGEVYPCDFYCLDAYRVGNIMDPETHFTGPDVEQKVKPFIEASLQLPDVCMDCPVRGLCRGGCRRDRIGFDVVEGPPDPASVGRQFTDDTGDEPRTIGLNRYCEAYKRYFNYAGPRMEKLARSIAGRQ